MPIWVLPKNCHLQICNKKFIDWLAYSYLALHNNIRFCTAHSVDWSFCPVITWRSITTWTASHSLASIKIEDLELYIKLQCHCSSLLSLSVRKKTFDALSTFHQMLSFSISDWARFSVFTLMVTVEVLRILRTAIFNVSNVLIYSIIFFLN